MPNYPANTMHTYLHRMHKRQKWWLPVLGPTATVLTTGTGRVWSIEDLAATFGVGASQMRASLARLERFGMIRTVGGRTEVRTRVPALAARHIERMPAYLAATCPYQVARVDGHAA